jgi:peptidyl-prolyl cis-trans isomerase SurA
MKKTCRLFPRAHALCVVALSVISLSLSAVAAEQLPEVADGVAAAVNGDVITFSQVRELVAPRERALRTTLRGQEMIDKIKEARLAALNDLIDRQLILQEFKKKEYNIPERVINERVEAIIREEFGGDRQAFVRTLQAQGYTMKKFRDAERDKVVVQAMRYQNVKGDFIVSPEKVDKFYTASKEQFTSPEQIHLWMIAVNKTPNLAKGEQDPQKAMAEEIRAKLLKKDAKFDQLAQMYSTDSSRTAGGDWGWIDVKTLNDRLSKIAFKLEPKKISPVIEEGNTYYILMVSEKKNAVTKPMTEVRTEIEKKLSSEERQRLQEQWIKSLRQKAFIKTF